jgi:hypothetical protein
MQALEEQRLLLEQQLRQVQEEKRCLKKQRLQQRLERTMTTNRHVNETLKQQQLSHEQTENNDWKIAFQTLDDQRQILQQTKRDLERLWNEYSQTLERLKQSYQSSKANHAMTQETLEEQVAMLQLRLEELLQIPPTQKSRADVDDNEDPEWLQERISEARQRAVEDYWNQTGRPQLKQLEVRLQEQHQRDLQTHRQATRLALDNQRHKMRTLARDMAQREYNVIREQQQQEEEEKDLLIMTAQQEEEQRQRRQLQAQQEAERQWQAKQKEEQQRQKDKQQELEKERQKILQKQEAKDRQAKEDRQREKEIAASATANTKAATKKDDKSTSSGAWFSTLSHFFPFRNNDHSKKMTSAGASSASVSTVACAKIPITNPQPAIENWQRRVPWQPISLPPNDVMQITFPNMKQNSKKSTRKQK